MSEDVADISLTADVEMKEEETKNDSEEIVKEELEPEASDNAPKAADAPEASTSEEVAVTSEEAEVEEKPVLAEPETEPMEVDTPKEGKYQKGKCHIVKFIYQTKLNIANS